MAVKSSRQLVIDANVASAAGDKGTGPSKACRAFLEEVRKVCHRMVLTPAIKDEWDRHQSPFARRWRVAMQSKKKMVSLQADQNEKIRGLIEHSTNLQNEGERNHLRKTVIW
ncbi:MAG: hypothetical protein HC884_13555 [Chloroflexaceae bacterium]|nr:hypothetical protein [Chloroflexaceae bacterium]